MTNLMGDYQNIIAMSRYARWKEEDQRRETWQETVTRLLNFYNNYLKINMTLCFQKKFTQSYTMLSFH